MEEKSASDYIKRWTVEQALLQAQKEGYKFYWDKGNRNEWTECTYSIACSSTLLGRVIKLRRE